MANKSIRALHSFEHHNLSCKKGDTAEVAEKDADLLIARGLAEPADSAHHNGELGTLQGPTPENKMAPPLYSDK